MANPNKVYIEFIDNCGDTRKMTYNQCAEMMAASGDSDGNGVDAIKGRYRKRVKTGNTIRQCIGLDDPNRIIIKKSDKKTSVSLVNSFLRKGLIPIKC